MALTSDGQELLDLLEAVTEMMIRKRIKAVSCSRFTIELDPGSYNAARAATPLEPKPKPSAVLPGPQKSEAAKPEDEDLENWSSG